MAGSPKKRARNEAEAVAAAALGVDPTTVGARSNVHTLSPVVDAPRVGAEPTQGRTRAHAGARTRTLQPGTLQRSAVDANAQQQMRAFAEVLDPESVVRIERIRPTFAAGVCEDFICDAGGLAELIEHVRGEHGGQRYKLTLLSADGTELMVFKLNVPGAPRFEGKRVPRGYWTGDDEPRERNAATPAPSSSDGTLAAVLGILGSVITQAMAPREDNSAAIVATVRQIAETSAQQTGALLTTIAQQGQTPQRSIVEQLNEVAVAHRAIGKLRDAIVDDTPALRSSNDDTDNGGLLGSALKQAAAGIIAQGFQNSQASTRRAQSAPQQQPAQQPAPQQQQAPATATNVRRIEGRPLRSAE